MAFKILSKMINCLKMKIIIGERELKEGDAIERNKFSH